MKTIDLSSYHYFKNLQTYQAPESTIVSIGVEIPDNYVDNKALVEMIDAPASVKKLLPSMIRRATKCKSRVYSPPGTSPSDLAVAAARKAFDRCDIDPAEIDTLIFSSTDMDTLEPATANIVQKKMGLTITNSFDVSNACNSFLQAMNVANSLII
ncbi:MAG: ketoacyl-ACP synthase III, partial [Deltaproteobacteria bacterium]|nr:ketoacyl-ACP synthase III [Deltaproteobacteria bacterium]